MIVLSFLVVVLVVGAIVDVIRSPASLVKRGTKSGWLLTVLLLPVIGGALWFAFGRRRGEYDLDEYAEDSAADSAPDPARAAEHVRSVEGPAEAAEEQVDTAEEQGGLPKLRAGAPSRQEGPRTTPRTTEEQLADLEAEIAFWEEWSRKGGAARTAGASSADGDPAIRD